MKKDVLALIPIHRKELNILEQFSVDYSLHALKKRTVCFFGPRNLDRKYYFSRYSKVPYCDFDDKHFSSISEYNRLLMSGDFYNRFDKYNFLLILQPDAIVIRDELDFWLSKPFDFIGAPWPDRHELRVSLDVGRFSGQDAKQLKLKVGNGGLSLRRTHKFIELLEEFPEAAEYFRINGLNEDLYFSAMAMLSGNFIVPNEIIASRFSLELEPSYYYRVNGGKLSMGAHAWWKYEPEFWLPHLRNIPSAVVAEINSSKKSISLNKEVGASNSFSASQGGENVLERFRKLRRKLDPASTTNGVIYSKIPSGTTHPRLSSSIQLILQRLPDIEGVVLNGETYFYGANWQIAKSLHMSEPLPSNVSWLHGVNMNIDAMSMNALRKAALKNNLNLVYKMDQVKYLEENGYAAKAVGAPILYASPPKIERIPNSLLIMPAHSTAITKVNTYRSEEFASLAKSYSLVVACISGMCVSHGLWMDIFEGMDIPWITGAWVFDRNALLRIQVILRSFEYMATDSMGSHVAYAAFCGCKVFFMEDLHLWDLKLIGNEPFYRDHPELLTVFPNVEIARARLSEKYPFFFSKNDADLELQRQWANHELGIENKKTSSEIASLLGWSDSEILGKITMSNKGF